MPQPLVPGGRDLGRDVGVVQVKRAGVLYYAPHASGGEGVTEFPEGGAGKVEACDGKC